MCCFCILVFRFYLLLSSILVYIGFEVKLGFWKVMDLGLHLLLSASKVYGVELLEVQ